ncbi:hypothetical protein C8F04DRAFT_1201156 [Mycena alexandri]|uniref:Uncharacterized protein n=1 Tax=Mycena alexandri TaxID=1745969 RepID=A0AAD6RXF0_9AGAR|nr:hypothetical protein C8F04DRAFT_1201156 [Mycena alexandri]
MTTTVPSCRRAAKERAAANKCKQKAATHAFCVEALIRAREVAEREAAAHAPSSIEYPVKLDPNIKIMPGVKREPGVNIEPGMKCKWALSLPTSFLGGASVITISTKLPYMDPSASTMRAQFFGGILILDHTLPTLAIMMGAQGGGSGILDHPLPRRTSGGGRGQRVMVHVRAWTCDCRWKSHGWSGLMMGLIWGGQLGWVGFGYHLGLVWV